MKIKMYLRVGRDDKRRHTSVEANVRPNQRPLTNTRGLPIPTVAFGLLLDIPDGLFAQAEQIIAEIAIPESAATVAAEVTPLGELT